MGIVAEYGQPHRAQAGGHRPAGGGVAGEPRRQPLAQRDAGAFPRGVEHRGRLGVMVEPQFRPVIHDHRQIEIVRTDARARRHRRWLALRMPSSSWRRVKIWAAARSEMVIGEEPDGPAQAFLQARR